MSVTDTKRFELHQTLREELGAQAADTLMEYLPPTGWSDVARRQDVDGLRVHTDREFVLVRSEIDTLRSDMNKEFTLVRSEIDTLRSDMNKEFTLVRTEMSTLRTELQSEMAVMKAELMAYMEKRFNQNTKWMLTFMTANFMTMASLVATVAIKL